jgi:hypothetical protein
VIHVHRADDQWVTQSGSILAKSRSLDVALIEVFRSDSEVQAHGRLIDHAAWIREQAASIEGGRPSSNRGAPPVAPRGLRYLRAAL